MTASTTRLLSIGRFARTTGLSIRTLRRYDALGLLAPAHVDDDTGYRYYTLEQARDGEAIRRLRALDVPLDEVRALLHAPPEALREGLATHRARLEGQAVELRQTLEELSRLIAGEEQLVPEKEMIRFEIGIQDLDEVKVLVIREHVHQDEMSTVVPNDIAEVHGYVQELGLGFHGPPICVCPFPNEDGTLDAEIGWPVPKEVPGRGRFEFKELPATRALVMKHVGPFSALGSAYRLMAEVMEENGLTATGAPREMYVSDPEQVSDPNDYETLIAWPIGPEGELKPGGFFKRRVEVE
ncbi:MAG: MerR family transcriptional regulator [Actinobacteria bacterium]|nr:MerR family transcriptional regulator [Actinomycetota bacterium]